VSRVGVRLRLVRAVRQVLGAIAPPEPSVPRAVNGGPSVPAATHRPVPAYLPADDEAARLRARRALAEARAEMPTLLADSVPPTHTGAAEHIPAEATGLRQALRTYTDHVDRLLAAADEERRVLRDQVSRLSEELLMLRAEMAEVRAALPAAEPGRMEVLLPPVAAQPDAEQPAPPPASLSGHPVASEAPTVASSVPEPSTAPSAVPQPAEVEPAGVSTQGPAPNANAHAVGPMAVANAPPAAPPAATAVGAARADDLARLEGKVFPAGTIGLLLVLYPVDDFHRLTGIQEGLGAESAVEHIELSSYVPGEARLRLTFRQPVRWPWLRAAIERAAGSPIDLGSLTLERGSVKMGLLAGGVALRRGGSP
jgi:hypothetical protein